MKLTSLRKSFYVIAIIVLSVQNYCFSQATMLKKKLLNYTVESDSLTKKYMPEKPYLQFDKPYYSINDTLWFKAYLLNATYLTAPTQSSIIHIDIANDSNKVIKQYRLPMQSGLTWGNIGLDEKEFTPGTYTVRAYTNWMRNFGEDCFYYKTFYVSSANENNLLVKPGFTVSSAAGNQTINAKLLFTGMDSAPYAVKPLEISVTNNTRNLYRQKLQTGVDGDININFKLPEKLSGLAIIAESEQKDKRAAIPVILNRPEKVDIQFLPEGGNLVAGLPARVGFKAIGEDGRRIEISGIIADHEQKKVAEFKSIHNGMGSFELAVQPAERYTAMVRLPGGTIKVYQLPPVKASGIILRVKNLMESDSVDVVAIATNDISKPGESYFLIGRARGIVCYAAVVDFYKGFIRRKIAKSLFPSGITRFTLTTTKYQPLNERLVFIKHDDNLHIKFITEKHNYDVGDSIGLKLKVMDRNGNPIIGNFSIAVTDDAQVKKDSLNCENISTRMLLTSDLKGDVEQPGYYFTNNNDAWKALDNLLLTQGWLTYERPQGFNQTAAAIQPETEFEVTGTVLNAFKKPVKGTKIVLFSKSPFILMDTITNNDGKFRFTHFPRIDTPIFVLKAVNKNGQSFNVNIKVDEVKRADFITPVYPLVMPWYVNSDTTLLNYTRSDALEKQQRYFPNSGHILKEVKITAQKIIKDSQNLNGPGNADFVIEAREIEKAGKINWLQLFEKTIEGFRLRTIVIGNKYFDWYFVKYKWARIFVDGIEIDPLITHPLTPYVLNFTQFLESQTAEDIKGIEINLTSKYVTNYERRFGGYRDPIILQYAFIEVTTRSGHGPFIDNTPGIYLHKPLPLTWPKQFYKPKYTVNDIAKHSPDLRSTIDWEPNVTTNANGEAKLWFYAADKPSIYTVIIEGTDMNGNLGYKYGKVYINKSKPK
jgi:hypothetical protein